MPMALEDMRVLDLSRYQPGWFVSMYLGDMGADVIKLEDPSGGRREGFEAVRAGIEDKDPWGTAHNALERNKRKMVLNLKHGDGKTVFYKLVESADVLLEMWRPGVAQRLGADYETCSKINPRLVYCSFSGYGQDGPYRELPGHDLNYISVAGALGLIRGKDGAPAQPPNWLADFAGGSQNALIGILTALVARSRTGRGQHVDTSMTDGVIALSALFVQNYFTSGQPPAPPALNPNPNYTTYETKDGRWVSLGTIEPWFFAAVCQLVGRPDLAEHLHDPAKRQEINDAFQAAFKTRTADEWQRMALEADTAVTKVYDFPEVFEDAQVRHRQMVLELDHPEVGKVRHLGFSPKLSETPGSMRRFPGSRGQHTDEVLAELGYTQSEIGDLHRQGAVS